MNETEKVTKILGYVWLRGTFGTGRGSNYPFRIVSTLDYLFFNFQKRKILSVFTNNLNYNFINFKIV